MYGPAHKAKRMNSTRRLLSATTASVTTLGPGKHGCVSLSPMGAGPMWQVATPHGGLVTLPQAPSFQPPTSLPAQIKVELRGGVAIWLTLEKEYVVVDADSGEDVAFFSSMREADDYINLCKLPLATPHLV